MKVMGPGKEETKQIVLDPLAKLKALNRDSAEIINDYKRVSQMDKDSSSFQSEMSGVLRNAQNWMTRLDGVLHDPQHKLVDEDNYVKDEYAGHVRPMRNKMVQLIQDASRQVNFDS